MPPEKQKWLDHFEQAVQHAGGSGLFWDDLIKVLRQPAVNIKATHGFISVDGLGVELAGYYSDRAIATLKNSLPAVLGADVISLTFEA
jgi:hypothetical protein